MERRLRRKPVLKAGLGMLALSVVLTTFATFSTPLLGPGGTLLVLGGAGVSGALGLLTAFASLLLPPGPNDTPTFTEELMGQEEAQYGIFTEGNWMKVLDRQERREKAREPSEDHSEP